MTLTRFRLELLRGGTRVLACSAAVAAVFFGTPLVNRIYDGWPRGWLVLSVAILSSLFGGAIPGLAALATGVALIWWRGTFFTPMHPGLEVFAAIGIVQVLVIHRLRRQTRALRLSEAMFAKAFRGNAAGMAIMQPDGLVVDVNEAFARLTGYRRDELIDRSAYSLWTDPAERTALFDDLQRHGGVTNREASLITKDGHRWTALLSAQITTVQDQEVVISSVLDISDRKRAEEALRDAARLKDEFLAVLSHELRTPLNVILGYSRILQGPRATPDFVETTSRIIERNAVAQMRLVEDLLDVQRIINGGLQIEYAPFDLRLLIQSVLESLGPMAAAKRLDWTAQVDEMTIDADRARIQQVLWNLVSNAIKFTPEDGSIAVTAGRDGDDVVITVADTGEGIPEHFVAHIFEPFRQVDMSTTRRHGGLGLGLAIAREIVDAHGGAITAETTQKGARFTVRLPAHGPAVAHGFTNAEVA